MAIIPIIGGALAAAAIAGGTIAAFAAAEKVLRDIYGDTEPVSNKQVLVLGEGAGKVSLAHYLEHGAVQPRDKETAEAAPKEFTTANGNTVITRETPTDEKIPDVIGKLPPDGVILFVFDFNEYASGGEKKDKTLNLIDLINRNKGGRRLMLAPTMKGWFGDRIKEETAKLRGDLAGRCQDDFAGRLFPIDPHVINIMGAFGDKLKI